jgi:hypothetical protein
MQEVQTQAEDKGSRHGKCCGKKEGRHAEKRGKCGSHKEAGMNAPANPLEILQVRFARGEIDTAEFEEKRRLIAYA